FLSRCDIGLSTFLGAFRPIGLAAQLPVKDEQIMESATAVALRPAEEQDMYPQPPADLAGASFPGTVAKDLSVYLGTVRAAIVHLFVVAQHPDRFRDGAIASVEP